MKDEMKKVLVEKIRNGEKTYLDDIFEENLPFSKGGNEKCKCESDDQCLSCCIECKCLCKCEEKQDRRKKNDQKCTLQMKHAIYLLAILCTIIFFTFMFKKIVIKYNLLKKYSPSKQILYAYFISFCFSLILTIRLYSDQIKEIIGVR
jgi:hypothetical protein